MKIKIPVLPVIIILFSAVSLFPITRISNYSSILTVNAFAVNGNVIWAGTSGGLYRYDCSTGAGTLYTDAAKFPDLFITSLCLDPTGTLWIGTKQGYLYRRTPDGRQGDPISAYNSVGWPIKCLSSYGKYLIVGSQKGCSLFDKARLEAVKNASSFGPAMLTPEVNAILVYHDSLILGCSRGVAKLPVGGSRLDNANFFDPSIWTLDSSWSFPVKSFVVRENGFTALPTCAALFKGKVITSTPDAASTNSHGLLFADTVPQMAFPSSVNAIVPDTQGGRSRCLVGTLFNHFYFWSGGSDTQHVAIDGPNFFNASGVWTDHDGDVWVMTGVDRAFAVTPLWYGISAFRNNHWKVYSPVNYAFGPFGNGRAGVEDLAGNMWFGTAGGSVKKWIRSGDSWAQYCIGAHEGGSWYSSTTCMWGECDGMARDSLGYLWFGSWEDAAGPLLCYDPRFEPAPSASTPKAAHFRYFFPGSNQIDYSTICVDAANNIIACNSDAGAPVQVYSYTGDPLVNDLQPKVTFSSCGNIGSVVATGDTLTYLAGGNGLFTWDPDSSGLFKGLWIKQWTSDGRRSLKLVDSAAAGGALALQDDNILWIGTSSAGLIRYDLSAPRQGDFSLGSIKTVIDQTQGLLSNNINQIAIDKKGGNLWVATDRGVSACHLDYSMAAANNQTARVYPNPFSKQRHSRITFADLPPSSRVYVYTVAGSLVATLTPGTADQSANGAACMWNPPNKIVPGLYFYAVQSPRKNSRGKIIIAP